MARPVPTGVLLLLAVLAEVTGTAGLSASAGLTRPGPLLVALLAYAATTALIGRVFARGARVGAAYGLLTGCGLLAATLLSVVVDGDVLTTAQLAGVLALGVGVLMVQVGRR